MVPSALNLIRTFTAYSVSRRPSPERCPRGIPTPAPGGPGKRLHPRPLPTLPSPQRASPEAEEGSLRTIAAAWSRYGSWCPITWLCSPAPSAPCSRPSRIIIPCSPPSLQTARSRDVCCVPGAGRQQDHGRRPHTHLDIASSRRTSSPTVRNLRSTRPGRGGLTVAAGLVAMSPSVTASVSSFFNVTRHRVTVAGASSPDMLTVHAATSLRRRSARRTTPNRG